MSHFCDKARTFSHVPLENCPFSEAETGTVHVHSALAPLCSDCMAAAIQIPRRTCVFCASQAPFPCCCSWYGSPKSESASPSPDVRPDTAHTTPSKSTKCLRNCGLAHPGRRGELQIFVLQRTERSESARKRGGGRQAMENPGC